MSINFENRTPERNISKICGTSESKGEIKTNILNDEDSPTVFSDFRKSAICKAACISPEVKCVTLGVNSAAHLGEEEVDNESAENSKKIFNLSALYSSTPEKSLNNSLHKKLKSTSLKKKMNDYSSLEINSSIENSFSQLKLLEEYEVERKRTISTSLRERIQNMYDAGKLFRDGLEHLKQARQEEAAAKRLFLERKIIDDIHEQEILNKPKREAQLAKDNLKETQRILERDQKVKEAEEEAKKKAEALLRKKKQNDEILNELQKEYNVEYKNISETLKLCKDKVALAALTASQSKLLKNCASDYENLFKKFKQGDANDEDHENSKKLIETLKSIHKTFINEITKINESMNAEKKKTESIKKAEETKKPQKDSSEISITPELEDYFDGKTFSQYMILKARLEAVEKSIEPLLSDDSCKKFRFSIKKACTIPVNSISPVDAYHLYDKYFKLHNLLSGHKVRIGDSVVSAASHPLGIIFVKHLLAQKFIRQGDLVIATKPDAAFCLASVIASLWVDFPDFGEIFLAHFQSVCPYVIPVFLPHLEGQSNTEYYSSLGYHCFPNGDIEAKETFLKRMSGLVRLYCAILISSVRQPGKLNPLGLSEAWRWISALMNLDPKPDICATILRDFLEVTGNEMLKTYGFQFKKLLAQICQEYYPKLEQITPEHEMGPLVRLETFLTKTLKHKSIPPPPGALPPHFW